MRSNHSGSQDLEEVGEGVQKGSGRLNRLFLIDHHFALNQIDIIENCDTLQNIVVSDTVLRHLLKKNVQSFHGLRNTVEQTSRKLYYFYNENFTQTFVPDNA
mmetsp:Transcript_18119/g.30951  ORF Transcript_18119/g.30951 Transcript_18119/m.30951 type:complete len:102 (+) Transcript_18119:294-599(+)